MAAYVVGDHGVRHAVLAQFPSSEASPLIAWARLVDVNMDGDAVVESRIDWRGRRTEIDEGKPSRIAVSEDVDGLAVLGGANLAD